MDGSCGCPSAPSHQWTFDDGTADDSVGSADGTLFNGATVSGGQLVLDNLSTDPDQHTSGEYMSAPLPDAYTVKTLVAWVSLANLTQQGGTALTMEGDSGSYFDAIDYAERVSDQWMSGSDGFARSPSDNGGAAETSTSEVAIAIVYASDNSITIYRNGAAYASYTQGTLQSYPGGTGDDILLGLRHSQCGNNCWLSASIDEARVYDSALTACQVQSLPLTPP
jgi:hypothetical protein